MPSLKVLDLDFRKGLTPAMAHSTNMGG